MKRLLLFLPLALFFCGFIPSTARASLTHTYSCGDFDTITGAASCHAGALTFTSAGTQVAYDDVGNTTFHWNLNQASTWYLTFTVTSPSGTGLYDCIGSTITCVQNSFTGDVSDQSFSITNPGNPNGGGIIFRNNSGAFSGTISNICITDTIGGCGGGGGGGGNTIATSSGQLIDYVNGDFYLLWTVFIGTMGGTIWFFRRPRT